MTEIMSGKVVANLIKERSKNRCKKLKEQGITPKLGFVRVGEKSDSVGYHCTAKKRAEKIGLETKDFIFDEKMDQEAFEEAFIKINQDPTIHGILLFRPLPKHFNEEKITFLLNPNKDIDGMNPFNLGKVFTPCPTDFIPCTPVSVMRLLEHYGISLEGKDVVVVGHSLVVGRPLSMLLSEKNATVTICNIHTKDLKAKTKEADIVICAVGKKHMITQDFVKDGVVLIDVGTSYDEQGQVFGDMDFDDLLDKASYINPVPGGIGAITTAILIERVIEAASETKI